MSSSNPFILTAAALWSGTGQNHAPGAIVVEAGRIAFLGHPDDARRAYPGAQVVPFFSAIILPGLVNAHTHLELTLIKKENLPTDFIGWVKALMAQTTDPAWQANIQNNVGPGGSESHFYGVTTIGDISRFHHQSRQVLHDKRIRTVSFGEIIGLGTRRDSAPDQIASAADPLGASSRLTIGLSPHAPYTVEGPVLQQIIARAVQDKAPIAMHLAEHPYEQEFLTHLTGPLRELWNRDGRAGEILDAKIPRFDSTPVAWAKHWGLLDAPVPVLLAHCNYLTDSDIKLLAAGRASVVVCPRTRAFFGHTQPHRFEELLAAGVNVCLGTDSRASNPDLNVFEEARLLHELHPQVSLHTLLEMVTTRGARALGLSDVTGTLAVGRSADFCVKSIGVDTPEDSLDQILAGLFTNKALSYATFIAGRSVWGAQDVAKTDFVTP